MLGTSDACTVRGSMFSQVVYAAKSAWHMRLRPEPLGMRFSGGTQFERAAPVVCPSSQRCRSPHHLAASSTSLLRTACGGNHLQLEGCRSTTPAPCPTSLVLSFKHTPAVLSMLSAILASTNMTSPQTTILKARPSPPRPSPPSPRASSASLWTASRPRSLTAPPAAGGVPGQLLPQLTGRFASHASCDAAPLPPGTGGTGNLSARPRVRDQLPRPRVCTYDVRGFVSADVDSLDPALVAPRAFPLSLSSLRARRSPRWARGDIGGTLGASFEIRDVLMADSSMSPMEI
ncbi:hypothetical protein B0H11DRAFT_2216665 [Mycena galericulata]|nr:hypothetical protein B0H11DRAFT_2216665 [Mycena galericulata]